MKTLIVSVAALLILLAFPLQTVLDNKNTAQMAAFDSIVHSYAERARMEGRFTDEILSDMRQEIADTLGGIEVTDVLTNCTTAPRYRTIDHYDERELIFYEVSIPIKNAFVGGPIFSGIDDELIYTCSGAVTSEVLP